MGCCSATVIAESYLCIKRKETILAAELALNSLYSIRHTLFHERLRIPVWPMAPRRNPHSPLTVPKPYTNSVCSFVSADHSDGRTLFTPFRPPLVPIRSTVRLVSWPSSGTKVPFVMAYVQICSSSRAFSCASDVGS